MKEVWVCLLGEWVNLSAHTDVAIEDDYVGQASLWWEEKGAKLYDFNYIKVTYKGVEYNINPIYIQIVNPLSTAQV